MQFKSHNKYRQRLVCGDSSCYGDEGFTTGFRVGCCLFFLEVTTYGEEESIYLKINVDANGTKKIIVRQK